MENRVGPIACLLSIDLSILRVMAKIDGLVDVICNLPSAGKNQWEVKQQDLTITSLRQSREMFCATSVAVRLFVSIIMLIAGTSF